MSLLTLVFFNYVKDDYKHHNGQNAKMCLQLMDDLNTQTATIHQNFFDDKSISLWKGDYKEQINAPLNVVNFFIPFTSPQFLSCDFCRNKLKTLQELNRNDLILPIFYVDCQYFERTEEQEKFLKEINSHQDIDWGKFLFQDFDKLIAGQELLAEMTKKITIAIQNALPLSIIKPEARADENNIEKLPEQHAEIKQNADNIISDLPEKPDWAHTMGRDVEGLWFELSQHSQRCQVYVPSWCSDYGFDQYGFYADLEHYGICQRFRWIMPGRFFMGSPETEPERTVYEDHQEVIFTRGFWLADTACTQALWQVVMGNNPACFKDSANNPVECVSWEDTQGFLQRLNAQVPALKAGLPTEAQWEYACRAGTVTPFSFGTTITHEQVNYNGTRPYNQGKKGLYRQKTVPVKSLPANPWGLYEMHGNVWEMCHDYWIEDLSRVSVTDLNEPEPDSLRVLRGGGWFSVGWRTRSANRNTGVPSFSDDSTGFRFALSP